MRRAPKGGRFGTEFSVIATAEGLSTVGDQLAKVAIALLVYHRTGSAALSGLAYGLTFLPPLLTGPTLSCLADRFPRRTVMLSCCLIQAAVVAGMAQPDLPLAVVVAGALAVAAVQTPFRAAQGAMILGVVGPARNKAARTRLMMIREVGQLAGLGGGAALVMTIGTTPALLLDVATFLAAAALIRTRVRKRGAARPRSADPTDRPERAWKTITADPAMRSLTILIAVIGFTAVPDAIIVPFARQIGAPTWVVGPLLAADCVGVVVGARLVEARPPARQRALIGPLAMASVAPLALFALRPTAWLAGALLIASGIGSAYLPLAAGELTERVPDSIAGATNGLLNVILRVSQGAAAIAAGFMAQAFSPTWTIAAAGGLGLALAGVCARRWGRMRPASMLPEPESPARKP